ncbi:hypothetical protein ACT7DA_15720 [Bacillus pacificus]
MAPVYRAEHHNSSRHLNEYISLGRRDWLYK